VLSFILWSSCPWVKRSGTHSVRDLFTQTDKYMYRGEAAKMTSNPITAKTPTYIPVKE